MENFNSHFKIHNSSLGNIWKWHWQETQYIQIELLISTPNLLFPGPSPCHWMPALSLRTLSWCHFQLVSLHTSQQPHQLYVKHSHQFHLHETPRIQSLLLALLPPASPTCTNATALLPKGVPSHWGQPKTLQTATVMSLAPVPEEPRRPACSRWQARQAPSGMFTAASAGALCSIPPTAA
jgi:hypothetical protein